MAQNFQQIRMNSMSLECFRSAAGNQRYRGSYWLELTVTDGSCSFH